MNTSKTKIACIGKNRHVVQGQIKHKFSDLQWVTDKFYILGITIPLSSNDTLLRELYYTPKLVEMRNMFNKWKKNLYMEKCNNQKVWWCLIFIFIFSNTKS